MRGVTDNSAVQEVISVWVRDPRIQKHDFWHAYLDYEICLHTNSRCFTKKISCVRRRFSEFVWLRQKLQENSMLMAPRLPQLPPKNPFFSLNNAQQISERMKGLQRFLQQILQNPLLLSDSCLHLFLQSQLSVCKMEACAAGRTHYSVAQAVQRGDCSLRRFCSHEDLHKKLDTSCDFGSDSSVFMDPETCSGDGVLNTAGCTSPLHVVKSNHGENLRCTSVSL